MITSNAPHSRYSGCVLESPATESATYTGTRLAAMISTTRSAACARAARSSLCPAPTTRARAGTAPAITSCASAIASAYAREIEPYSARATARTRTRLNATVVPPLPAKAKTVSAMRRACERPPALVSALLTGGGVSGIGGESLAPTAVPLGSGTATTMFRLS